MLLYYSRHGHRNILILLNMYNVSIKFSEDIFWYNNNNNNNNNNKEVYKVTGEWRRLHNNDLYALYFSPNIFRLIKSRKLRWAGHLARMWDRWGAFRVLVVKPGGGSALGRPRHRWEGNIKMGLREVWWGTRTVSVWHGIGTNGGLLWMR
jgi:hypothetical protein